MRKYYKFAIIIAILAIAVTSLSAKAGTGYTYSHDGKPIYSTVGMTITKDGIYTVISDNWKNSKGEAFPAAEFTNPEDMFLYTEENQNQKVYVVDSVSNNLFVFDEDINFVEKVNQFEVLPEDFTEEQIMAMKTRYSEGTGAATSVSFPAYLAKKGYTVADFLALADIPYAERTASQKFYISLLGVMGVYRNIKPARTADGALIPGQTEDLIYLCDAKNNQIVLVDAQTYQVKQVISAPTDISFAGKVFEPLRVVTDVAGRLYVISRGVYEGIMFMSDEGKFNSFIGVNYVTVSFWDTFWNKLKTDEQLAKQNTIVNTIFTSLAIDDEGFLYATSRAINNTNDNAMIKRINPSGKDVLTRNGYSVPKGDLVYVRTGSNSQIIGPSRFTAIAINDYGVYTVADEKSGRLFTYDDEGNLLYISGGSGNELDNLNNPVAIQYQGERILALDKANKAILRFEPSDIAVSINRAVKYYYDGNLTASSEEWKNVVAKNPNYEFAYVGIGKSLLDEGRYQEAMSYFQTGYNVDYYSQAYKLYRDQLVAKYFEIVMYSIIGISAALYGYRLYKRRKNRKPNDDLEVGEE